MSDQEQQANDSFEDNIITSYSKNRQGFFTATINTASIPVQPQDEYEKMENLHKAIATFRKGLESSKNILTP